MSIKYRKFITCFLAVAFIMTAFICRATEGNNDAAQRAKEFVVMGYEGIQFELKAGEGPYLKTLTELLNTKPEDHAQTVAHIRSLSSQFPNIMDFAENVVKLRVEPVGRSMDASVPSTPPIPIGPSIYSGDKLANALDHMTRGMRITVFVKTGGRFKGRFEEYTLRRLWILGSSRQSFLLDDILAIDAPDL